MVPYSPALIQALTSPAALQIDGTLTLVVVGAIAVAGYIVYMHESLLAAFMRTAKQASGKRAA